MFFISSLILFLFVHRFFLINCFSNIRKSKKEKRKKKSEKELCLIFGSLTNLLDEKSVICLSCFSMYLTLVLAGPFIAIIRT